MGIKGFWVGAWLHDAPEAAWDGRGRRILVRHLCFGPLETRLWYQRQDGQYCREVRFMEGPQAGEVYTEYVGQSEMLQVVESELALCKIHPAVEMAKRLQAEKDRLFQ